MRLNGGPARPSPDSSPRSRRASRPDAAHPGSGRREESRGDRNHSITEFFKPVPKQDRLVLNSPERTNHKYERGRLLDTGIGQFGKKITTTENMCEKMPTTPPNKNPITEILTRGFKEKKGERDTPERDRPPVVEQTPSLVVEQPLISTSPHCMSKNEMKDPRKEERSPVKMSSHNHGNMREKAKCTDRNKTIKDAKNLVSSAEPEILKNSSSKIGDKNDMFQCQQLECSVNMQQEPGNGCRSRKRLHSDSLEDASDAESSGVSDAKACIVLSSEKEREVTLPKAPITYSVSSRIKKQREGNFKDFVNRSSMKTSNQFLPFLNSSITKGPLDVLGDDVSCSTNTSRPSHENLENSSSTNGIPRKKLKLYFDSDEENLDCNLELESDEEDVSLQPLEQIMSLNSSKPTTPEKPFVLSEHPRALSSNDNVASNDKVSVRNRCYDNSLERLVKENDNPPRSDKWEKELKEDIVKGQGIKSQMETEETENIVDCGELREEHREFIRKFFIALDTIPDCHPGEEIFHCFDYGKIFNQHTLDLRDCNFVAKNAIEDLIFKSGKAQQIFLTAQGYLSAAYHDIQCPVPVLKWLFQMMSVHTDSIVSIQLLNTLIDMTIRNDITSGSSVWPWIPSLSDIATVFVNMGVSFKCLFPLQNHQPVFNEDIFNEKSISEEGKSEAETVVSCLPETNILNVVKFIGLCTAAHPEGYTDQEIILLLLMFLKMSLEKHLKQIALVDFQSLLINLLKNIRDWDTKMPELSVAISELSTHHHNLLWLVQLVPNWTARGRQVRQHLSLVIIAKFLDKKAENIPVASDQQMPLLCQYLVQMKPPELLRKVIAKKTGEQQDNLTPDCLSVDIDQEVYYLTYVLLHLVSEVSSNSFPFQRRKYLLQLCGSVERYIKCCIREDARYFHRTKVIDLVAIIQGKWQEMIQNSQPIQGKLHDFWEPDS